MAPSALPMFGPGHAVSALILCPVCVSDTGQQVRAAIFGPDFLFNVAVAFVPFVVMACVVAAIDLLPVPGARRSTPPGRDAAVHREEDHSWSASHSSPPGS
jgi:hypothetical protein